MRIQENDETPQEVGTLEAIRCRVCVQGDAASPTAVRLELSSEQDLFFHYTHQLDERAFRGVREEQRLMIDFQDYANVLARSLNSAIKEPHTHLAVFIMNRDGNARLDFIQVRSVAPPCVTPPLYISSLRVSPPSYRTLRRTSSTSLSSSCRCRFCALPRPSQESTFPSATSPRAHAWRSCRRA